MVIGNGKRSNFWGDAWCGRRPLKDDFPRLFEISNDVGCCVAELKARHWNLSFRRWLDEQIQYDLNRLKSRLLGVGLNDEEDRPIWKWSKSGKYIVKSMYDMLTSFGPTRSFNHLWKAKIPLKIRILLWLIWHNAIATKDNMRRRNWEGDTTCRFCHEQKTIHHLFFNCAAARYTWSVVALALGLNNRPSCFTQYFVWIASSTKLCRNIQVVGIAAICWAVWKLGNRACFEKKLIRSPAELICSACSFLKYWEDYR